MKYKITIAAFTAIILILPLSSAGILKAQQPQPQPPQKQHTQLTPQEQQLSQCPASVINSLPPLTPGSFPVCQGSSLLAGASGPSVAQIRADLAAHPPGQQLNAIKSQINARLAKSPAGTTLDQILQQMTDQGLMNCPAIKNPAHSCLLSPPIKAGTISPPFAP
jgi:hypothetical protein